MWVELKTSCIRAGSLIGFVSLKLAANIQSEGWVSGKSIEELGNICGQYKSESVELGYKFNCLLKHTNKAID